MNHFENPHNIIFLPGLGDDWLKFVWLTATLLQWQCDRENARVFTYVEPLNWNAHNFKAVEQQLYWVNRLIENKKNNGETVSLLSISGGVSMALLYALQHPFNVDAIVCLSGWIQVHDTLKNEKNAAFVEAIYRLDKQMSESSEQEMRALTDRTLLVQPLEDTRVPLLARTLPGAQQMVIPERSHLAATTIGLFRGALDRNSLIHRWLMLQPEVTPLE